LTRFAVLAPIRDKRSDTIAVALRTHLFAPFACPRRLISDNAKEFTSDFMQSLYENFGIKKIDIAPYHPASSGLVERKNQNIVRILKHFVDAEDACEWDLFLPECMSAINTAFNVSIGDSPHFMLFAEDKSHPAAIESPERNAPIYNYDDYYKVATQRFASIRAYLKKELDVQMSEYLQSKNKHTKKRSLCVGDRCYVKHVPNVSENRKFAPNFEGPYVVREQVSENTYIVEHTVSGKLKRSHVDNILTR
jgi:hypothetical protein